MRKTISLFVTTLALCPLAVGDEPLTAEQRLDKAVEEVSLFSFNKAHEYFESALKQSEEGSSQWQQAAYGTAVCLHHISPPKQSNIKEAQRLYNLLLEKTPHSKFAPRTLLNLGRIAELQDFNKDKADLETARKYYQQVVDRWGKETIAGEATLRIAGTYIQTYKHKQARKGIKVLDKWLAKHPRDPLASAMWQYLGDTYFFPLKDYTRCLDCYDKADEIGFIEKGREGPIYWRMAAIADRFLKDRDRAVRYYTKIVKVVPTSGKAYESQLALKRLGAPVPRLVILEKMLGPVKDAAKGKGAGK